MSLLLPGRLRRWLIVLVIIPATSWLLTTLADRIARTHGENRVTRAFRLPQRWRSRAQAA